jgi:hypothetical protein
MVRWAMAELGIAKGPFNIRSSRGLVGTRAHRCLCPRGR